ncbi:MAG: hypothetical protein EA379_11230 [Phycisphaerales bacterium]|nr:MAG: hypothetical protein EA379_11230 [Phycisphaerales bacterium]
MKKMISAFAVMAVAGAAVATAAPVKDYSVSVYSLDRGAFSPRTGFTGTGFEASEGYNLGNINGQNGWTVFSAGAGAGNAVTDLQNKGRVLGMFKDTSVGPNSLRGGFSPTFKDPDAGIFNVDVKIDDDAGADYQIIGQAPSEGFLTFRVNFAFTGDILILDDQGLGLQFINTGVSWAQNEWRNFEVRYNAAANTMDYFYGGSHIYTSVAGMFAGSRVEEVILAHDNFQDFGDGSFSGGPAAGYFDNVKLVPTPGAVALLGLAGMAAARRRRA